MAFPFGPVLGAIASIGGGLISADAQRSTNDATAAQMALDREQQKEFAQQGIQWRVEDAKQAGIHPLYSLGASIPTFSPVTQPLQAPTGLGRGISGASQDISRAVSATSTATQRYTTARLSELSVQRGQLENDLLRLQIRRETSQVGPSFPGATATPGLAVPGQADSRIADSPMRRQLPHGSVGSMEPGAVTDRGFLYTGTGYAPVPSQDAKERVEDQILPEMAWAWRNMVKPNFGAGIPPGRNFLRYSGTHFVWSHGAQEWQEVPVSRRRPKTAYRPKLQYKSAGPKSIYRRNDPRHPGFKW